MATFCSRSALVRHATAALLLPLTTLSPRAAQSDGLQEVLKPCPDTRIICFSSLDPMHFLEPWEYVDGIERGAAIEAIATEVKRLDGVITSNEISSSGTTLYASFADGKDRATFYFPVDDNVIHFRSERPYERVWDQNENRKRLLVMRSSLRDSNSNRFPDRVRDLTFDDYQRVGRNEAGQIAAEREAME